MGIIEWERGRYDEARVHYEAALRTYRELGLEGEAAAMLASLGVTLERHGPPGRRLGNASRRPARSTGKPAIVRPRRGRWAR